MPLPKRLPGAPAPPPDGDLPEEMQRLSAWLAEQEALQPPPRPGRKEIASDLRALIDGDASLDEVSPEVQVLVINVQWAFAVRKDDRQRHARRQLEVYTKAQKRLATLQREIEAAYRATWKSDPAPGVADPVWHALARARRAAAEGAAGVREDVRQGDVQRRRCLHALRKSGLSCTKIAELLRVTDGTDWRTGVRAEAPSDYLRDYVDPDRGWSEDDGRGRLAEVITASLKPSRT